MAAFLGGYAAVWTAFGALAFTGDLAIHAAVDNWGWLSGTTYLIAAGALALAGAFQFSSLKDACLRQCRHPGLLPPRATTSAAREAASGSAAATASTAWAAAGP